MTRSPPVLIDEKEGYALLTLNRPEDRNTLSDEMIAAMMDAFTQFERRKDVRALVLAAQGPVFSAGHDLKEMKRHRNDQDRGRRYFEDLLARCTRMMKKIMTLPQPVIAAVDGIATAAGCQLVATCDLALAGKDARFATPGVHIGLFCSTPMVALTRAVSRKHAMEMLLLGEMIDAETAMRMGLVNRIVPHGQARAQAEAMAKAIAAKSALTIAIGKRAFYTQAELSFDDAYRHASEVMVENMLARDAEEGIDAFLEKRIPQWSGS